MSTMVTKPPSFGVPRDSAEPSRPAPRRTYGRRAATPTDEEPVRSVFTSIVTESPSKTLLNRWADNGKDWRASLGQLGSDPTSEPPSSDSATSPGPSRMRAKLTDFAKGRDESENEEDEEEEDAEALRKQLEKMRRAARGLPVEEDDQETPKAVRVEKEKSKSQVSVERKLAAFSSTLTSLPSSGDLATEPSSPLRTSERTSSADRSSTTEIMPKPKDRSAAPRRRTPTPTSPSTDKDDTTTRRISHNKYRQDSSSAPAPSSPDDWDSHTAEDKADHGTGLDDQFWADIANESEEETGPSMKAADKEYSPIELVPTASAPALFDSDDEDKKRNAPAKGKKPRPLSKKDMRAMQSGLAESRRNRAVEVNKVSGNYLPMSSYMLEAVKAIQETEKVNKPSLNMHSRSSPRTSPTKMTPRDDIVAFTPSSDNDKPIKPSKINLSTVSFSEPTSSPTPGPSRKERAPSVVPNTSDAADADDNSPDEESILAQERAKREQEAKRIEKVKALATMKAATLKRLSKATPKAKMIDEDDLEIVADEKLFADAAKVPKHYNSGHKGLDAKAVLDRFAGSSSPKITRHQQIVMRHAGKGGRNKDSLTETFVDFASKAFNHPGMKRSNGGAAPAGQKKGRDSVIDQARLDAAMRRRHMEQVEKVRKQKEEAWGRTRVIPERKTQDFEAIIAASAQEAPHDEDSEEEDDDFVPDDEDEVAEEDDEDRLQCSGDEDERQKADDIDVDEDGIEEQDSADEIVGASAAKELTPTREIEDVPTDTDDVTPRPARPRLNGVPSSTPTLQSDGQMGFAADGDAFGVFDGDEGGFSQLFEPTQVSGQPEADDAFAGLRQAGPVNLLHGDVLLPDNNISETQAARDNALIAGEVEAALETQRDLTQPKKMYMNDQGKLTQTRPSSMAWPSSRQMLSGPSDLLSDIAESPQDFVLSSTEKGTSEPAPNTSSPTRSPIIKHRIDRDDSPESDQPRSLIPLQRQKEDTFARMMRHARRAEAKKAAINARLIDNQAEESDEDEGWAINRDNDDEDDEGMDDGFVPDLVDDQAIDEEEKKRQDELAAAKLREIEQADDAKREVEARKVIEGQYRNKKRGADFFSDDEDDEEGGKRRRWSKKERRKRRLDREDGLEKLEGEENAFKAHYEAGLDSDFSDDEQETLLPLDLLPIEETMEDARPAWLIIKERAAKNRGRDLAREDEDLDRELGFDESGYQQTLNLDNDDEEPAVEEESQFSISRSIRTSTSINLDEKLGNRKLSVHRSTNSYAAFVRDESQVNRRMAGSAGVSVVVKKNTGPTATRIHGSGPRAPSRQSTTSSSKSGSVLLDKGKRFG